MTSEKNATKEPMFSEMTRAQRATLLGIITPILTVIFVLKTMSVTQYEPANRPWYAWPDLFLSDIAWGIGVSTSALALVGHRRIGLKALPFIQLAFISWMFFELVGYKFYFTTGSTLDWQLIVLYVRYIEQLWGMVSIFNETFSKSLIFGLLGLLAMLPWVMHWRMPADPKDKDFISPKKLAIVGITGVVLSPVFPLVATEQRLGRNTIVELGVSAVEHFRQKANSRQHLQLSRSDRKLTPRADTPPKNVVVIVMESTGAHVTGPYNPKAEKFTPTLTELAKESLVMENALTIVPHTSKALFSIHCGTLPNPTAALTEAGSNGILAPCLPELLGTQGYETAFFQGATMFFEDRYSLLENFGYDYMYGREELNADNTPFEKLK